MPKYTFHCQTDTCKLQFSRTLKMGEWPTHTCPNCKDAAPRLYEGFGFAFQPGAGTASANTGVHDHDYPTADKIIGRSSQERWGEYRQRQKVKDAVRKKGGSALVRRDGPGYVEYDAMTDSAKTARGKVVDQVVDIEKRTSSKT